MPSLLSYAFSSLLFLLFSSIPLLSYSFSSLLFLYSPIPLLSYSFILLFLYSPIPFLSYSFAFLFLSSPSPLLSYSLLSYSFTLLFLSSPIPLLPYSFSLLSLSSPIPLLSYTFPLLVLCFPSPFLSFSLTLLFLYSPIPLLSYSFAFLFLCFPIPLLSYSFALRFLYLAMSFVYRDFLNETSFDQFTVHLKLKNCSQFHPDLCCLGTPSFLFTTSKSFMRLNPCIIEKKTWFSLFESDMLSVPPVILKIARSSSVTLHPSSWHHVSFPRLHHCYIDLLSLSSFCWHRLLGGPLAAQTRDRG